MGGGGGMGLMLRMTTMIDGGEEEEDSFQFCLFAWVFCFILGLAGLGEGGD